MKVSKSAVFLFELMIIILVFTMAAAICTRIFASAFNMSVESRELTMSSINAQTVAEYYKAGKGDVPSLYFDRSWRACGAADAYYTVALEEQDGGAAHGNMRDAYVNVYKQGGAESIYSLHVKEFVG